MLTTYCPEPSAIALQLKKKCKCACGQLRSLTSTCWVFHLCYPLTSMHYDKSWGVLCRLQANANPANSFAGWSTSPLVTLHLPTVQGKKTMFWACCHGYHSQPRVMLFRMPWSLVWSGRSTHRELASLMQNHTLSKLLC